MNRFQKSRKKFPVKLLLSAAFICFIFYIFISGISSVSASAKQMEAENLKSTIMQSIVQCYAIEGFYPESLEYLKKNYGISYNEDDYVISYETIGSNLMPSVSVIPLKNKEDLS